MESFFSGLSPVSQALVAGLCTWGVTALGASLVFFTSSVNRRLLDLSLGFAAGVMMAAGFWSLLAPSINLSEEMGMIPGLTPSCPTCTCSSRSARRRGSGPTGRAARCS